MRVVEEPFVTRSTILRVHRPMEMTTDRPLTTLRRHKAASPGIPVPLRTIGGQMLGSVHLYSSLNTDAARAFRYNEPELAIALATSAAKLESSRYGKQLHAAVSAAASTLPVDALAADAPPQIRRFVDTRRRSSWRAFEQRAFLGEWVAQSRAWIATTNYDLVVEAAVELAAAAAKARADLIPPEKSTATTFFGTIERMNDLHAEIEAGSGQTVLVDRARLERAGLAVLGQGVAILEEQGPAGAYTEYMPAVSLDVDADATHRASPYGQHLPEGRAFLGAHASERDMAWHLRAMTRASPSLGPAPVTPLRVA